MMPPTDKPTIENRLMLVELAVARMEGQVSNLVTEFGDLKGKVEAMLCRLDDHQSVLYGERGKSGLITQGEHLSELERALKGYEKEPGLIADIKNLLTKMDGYEQGRVWLTRLVVGAIIAQIIAEVILK
jgi:hypothetical protein